MKIFIHGWESSNQGTKSIFFRERYPDMIIPNFTGNLQQRMEKLDEILSEKTGLRLVGSSFGGLMAAIFAMENESRVERLILLAPAIHSMEFAPYHERKISVPVWIFHGSGDAVIPLTDVERVAKNVFLDLSFNTMDDDHSLHKTFKTIDWQRLLVGQTSLQ
jgi:pimeloyl-ACP methyl ester carboxylesterase